MNVVYLSSRVRCKPQNTFLSFSVCIYAQFFPGELVHGSYQGKYVCDVWILVESIKLGGVCCKEVLLMVGS